MSPTLAFLVRISILYSALGLVGGWAWLLLRQRAPETWRPPAALLGVVLAQSIGWYWSAHVDRGLFEFWPVLLGVSAAGTATLAFRQRCQLFEGLRRPSAWRAEVGASVLSVLMFALFAWPLLARPILSISASNNDIAAYAAASRHISHAGFDAAGPIVGIDLGQLARNDVYGQYNLLSFAQWVTRREVFEIALPALALSCALLAQILAGLLRRTTQLPEPVVALLAVLPQSTFLFTYIVSCYFGSQLLGAALATAATVTLFQYRSSQPRLERRANTAILAAMCIGLAMTYPHMLFLFMPLVVGCALLRPGVNRHTRVELLGVVAVAAIGVVLLEPERLWLALDRTLLLGRVKAGWPLPGVLPVALVGFQGSWANTVTALTIVGSVILAVAAWAAARVLSRSAFSGWSLPATATVGAGLLTYAVLYFGRGGPDYEQWKWISFLQPLLCIALVAPLAAFSLMRWASRATLPLVLVLVGLLGWNTLASEDWRSAVGRSGNWVAPELGLIGRNPNLADVRAVNVDLGPYWETMWAADALSPRTTYLLQPTYYATSNPGASWTLVHRAQVPSGALPADVRLVGTSYALIRQALPEAGAPASPEGRTVVRLGQPTHAESPMGP